MLFGGSWRRLQPWLMDKKFWCCGFGEMEEQLMRLFLSNLFMDFFFPSLEGPALHNHRKVRKITDGAKIITGNNLPQEMDRS